MWIGGDSIAIDGLSACSIVDPKVFLKGQMGFGYAGSLRAGQVIKYGLELPDHLEGVDDMTYMVNDVVDALRDTWHKKGVLQKDNDVEDIELQCLLGYNGGLYYLDGDMQVGRAIGGYLAVGAGQDIALGALHALIDADLPPDVKLERALWAATQWCAGVRPPFNIIEIGPAQQAVVKKTPKGKRGTLG